MSDLDDIFQETRAILRKEAEAAQWESRKTVRRVKDAQREAPAEPQALFTNPENWREGRGIALIHEESQTLLGNFREMLHRSVAGAQRLIRVETPITISATEYVEGDWWLGKELEITPPETWHEKRSAVLDLVLGSLGVHSPATPLVVSLSYGGIARVELEFATTFAAMSETATELLQLPAGTNVLPVMSQDCKVALRVELAL